MLHFLGHPVYILYILCIYIYIQSIKGFLLWCLKNEYIPVLGSVSGQWSKYSNYLCFSSKVIRNWTLMLFLISPLAVSQDISAMSHSLTSQQIIHLWLDTQSCLKEKSNTQYQKEEKKQQKSVANFRIKGFSQLPTPGLVNIKVSKLAIFLNFCNSGRHTLSSSRI